jgi:uncharacterized protein (DUF58 family)
MLAVAERRLPALTRLKQPEALPIRLHRQRIYVLPTRFGLMFSAVLLVMLMGALNYNNNPALLLTCLLGAACYQSVFQAFRCINGVQLLSLQGEPCHAGEPLPINLSFQADGRARRSLRLRVDEQKIVFDIDGGDDRVRISVPAELRGWCRVGRILLYSEYPFGLFRVWSWLNPDFAALVYPRVELGAPPLPQADDASAQVATKRSGDEFGMLRDYHPSDPRRSIAWKASARHNTLLVKEFEQHRGHDIALEWATTAMLVYEARISRMAAWVNAAEAAQLRYVMRLPDETVGPGLGPDHRHACLRALALLPGATA